MIDNAQLEQMAKDILAGRETPVGRFLFIAEYKHRTAPLNALEAASGIERPKPPALVVRAAIQLGIQKESAAYV